MFQNINTCLQRLCYSKERIIGNLSEIIRTKIRKIICLVLPQAANQVEQLHLDHLLPNCDHWTIYA